MITLPLLRLGRLQLDPALRVLQPGSAASGLVVTATVAVPDTPADRSYGWDVAWADTAREASSARRRPPRSPRVPPGPPALCRVTGDPAGAPDMSRDAVTRFPG